MDKLPKKSLDIQGILDKIKTLPIDDTDKATILEEIKKNIMHPEAGENQNLDNIQSKYTKMNMPQGQFGQYQPNVYQPNFQQLNSQINPSMYSQQLQHQQQPDGSTAMTSAQFEILKNKIDSLQYELIDLLRHVKDYTQRYMNAIRQQDLDKINEYITGLFEVDKTLKEAQDLSETAEAEEEGEETTENDSVVSRATSGIKNFFGSIGNNVSGITNLVTSTANIANDYLGKKEETPSNTSNTSKISNKSNTSNANVISSKANNINNIGNSNIKPKSSNVNNTNSNTLIKSRNKNIVSVDEYISDMNAMEEMNALRNNIISSNSNNINSLGNGRIIPNQNEIIVSEQNENENETENKTNINESNVLNQSKEKENKPVNLEGALKQLNDKMNEDIENTVNNNDDTEVNQEIPAQNGGKRTVKHYKISKKETNLTKKIRLLKLKLTKNNLQKQLNDNKIISSKTKKIKNKK